MIALIQRVTHASVVVKNQTIAKVDRGILLFLGVEKEDTKKNADDLLHKIIHYRIFPDEQNKMSLSLLDIQGELLVVPQFTLAADTHKGTLPSFASSAPPQIAKSHFEYFIKQAKVKTAVIKTGEFGADMKVHLGNDGPVTFWLQK